VHKKIKILIQHETCGMGVIIDITGRRKMCASVMALMQMYMILFFELMFLFCIRCLNSVLEECCESVLNDHSLQVTSNSDIWVGH
jgi:hypothetical protein